MLNVFNYSDYRKLLSDFYQMKKSKNSNYSHRFMAQRLGFKSTGFFSLILKGKTNIASDKIIKFANLMKLKRKETDYFELLVLFNQSKNHSEKMRYFEKLAAFKDSVIKGISSSQFELYDKWYYTAVREVLAFYPFKDEYAKLASFLIPEISLSQAKSAVELLRRLDLIRRNNLGVYERTDNAISSGYNSQSMVLNNFQIIMLRHSIDAIERFPQKDRSFSTLTLSISKDGYQTLVEEIRDFRKRLLKISTQSQYPNTVYHLNFNIFPLSKSYRG